MRQVSLLKGFALSLAFAAPVAAFAGVADDSKASPFGICHGAIYQDLREQKTLTFGQKENLVRHGVRWVRADLRPAWQPWRMENEKRIWKMKICDCGESCIGYRWKMKCSKTNCNGKYR